MGVESETDVLELNFSLNGRQRNRLCIFWLFGLSINNISQSLNRDLKRLNRLPGACQTNDGTNDIATDDSESDQLSNRELAFQHQIGTDPEHG